MDVKEWRVCALQIGGDGDRQDKRNDISGPPQVSRILVVKFAVEEAHDNLQHWGAKAYFIASLAAKYAETLGFCSHGFVLLALNLELLVSGTVLPLRVLAMPVI